MTSGQASMAPGTGHRRAGDPGLGHRRQRRKTWVSLRRGVAGDKLAHLEGRAHGCWPGGGRCRARSRGGSRHRGARDKEGRRHDGVGTHENQPHANRQRPFIRSRRGPEVGPHPVRPAEAPRRAQGGERGQVPRVQVGGCGRQEEAGSSSPHEGPPMPLAGVHIWSAARNRSSR